MLLPLTCDSSQQYGYGPSQQKLKYQAYEDPETEAIWSRKLAQTSLSPVSYSLAICQQDLYPPTAHMAMANELVMLLPVFVWLNVCFKNFLRFFFKIIKIPAISWLFICLLCHRGVHLNFTYSPIKRDNLIGHLKLIFIPTRVIHSRFLYVIWHCSSVHPSVKPKNYGLFFDCSGTRYWV